MVEGGFIASYIGSCTCSCSCPGEVRYDLYSRKNLKEKEKEKLRYQIKSYLGSMHACIHDMEST